ncbi:MAG: hypothetical protein WA864_27230 [Acetobacteraceae bacterium]|jgi:DNA-binding NtrC family response regulator
MPARIVIAHDDTEFVDNTVTALRAAGYDVLAFADSMSALAALEVSKRVEVLITRVLFPQGTPNGVALGRMTRLKRPEVKVLFVARRDTEEHTEGVGEFLPTPARADDVVKVVDRLVSQR